MLMGKVKRSPQAVEAAVRYALAHFRQYCSLGPGASGLDRGNREFIPPP